MTTLKQESVLLKKLKSLSEIELAGILNELAEHLDKNRWQHLIYELAGLEIRDEIKGLESDYNGLQEEFQEAKSHVFQALNILEKIENIDDDIEKDINNAIAHLNDIS